MGSNEQGRNFGFVDRGELDAQGLAEMAAIQEHFLGRMKELGEEAAERSKKTGEPLRAFDIVAVLRPEGSDLSDEDRARLEAEVGELRRDPELMERVKRRIEEDKPVLDRLKDGGAS